MDDDIYIIYFFFFFFIFFFIFFFYSGVEHQNADWLGIHEKICQSLIPLRQTLSFLPSEEERQKREHELYLQKVCYLLINYKCFYGTELFIQLLFLIFFNLFHTSSCILC